MIIIYIVVFLHPTLSPPVKEITQRWTYGRPENIVIYVAMFMYNYGWINWLLYMS